ncbi:hypothetical protein RP20_CCG002186 [Aedes albopictus]|nr:hypothetical protein RP20_CCG002186 [Aedes albopictus]
MIHLYPLEEHPHFCSFYWGAFNGNSSTGSSSGSTSFSAATSTNYDGTLRSGLYEDPRIEYLRKISYGIALPIICALGIVGNVLNLVVLTRRNMRGTAYIYMRASEHLTIQAAHLMSPQRTPTSQGRQAGRCISNQPRACSDECARSDWFLRREEGEGKVHYEEYGRMQNADLSKICMRDK